MSATASDQQQLDILDRLAVLSEVDSDLQCVITRIANRAKTDDEGDDVRLLIQCRSHIARLHRLTAAGHKNGRY